MGSDMYKCNITHRYGFILRDGIPAFIICADKLTLMSRRILMIFPVLRFWGSFGALYDGISKGYKYISTVLVAYTVIKGVGASYCPFDA